MSVGLEDEAERLGEALIRCETQVGGASGEGLSRLRSLLDGVYALAPSAEATLNRHQAGVRARLTGEEEPLPEELTQWGPAARLLGSRAGLEVLRMEHAADDGHDASLAITWHSSLGIIGVWVPGRVLPSHEVGRPQVVLPPTSHIKVAEPTGGMRERFGTRAIVGLKDPTAIEVRPL